MIVKRLLDLLVIILLAPLWLPALVIIGILVRFSLGSPVLYRQTRPGKGERLFELVKFRTMRDTRDAAGRLLPDHERLTLFGRWLRSSSLDELPEILNVLRGDMSLVGPRPLLVKYLSLYSPEQRRRHEVLPGITGWAQINGRNRIGWDERFKLDVWYVDHRSLLLDLRILFLTVLRVLQRRDINASELGTMPEFEGPCSDSGGVRTPPFHR